MKEIRPPSARNGEDWKMTRRQALDILSHLRRIDKEAGFLPTGKRLAVENHTRKIRLTLKKLKHYENDKPESGHQALA